MEGIWRARISTNKSRLCDLTSISLRFLDKCVERKVLNSDERNDIARQHDYDKKSKFYDIILTKDENCYEVMVNIMTETETKQSDDVLNILTGQLDGELQNQPGSSRQIESVGSQLSSMALSSPTRRPRVCFDLVQPLVDVIGRDDALNDLHKLVSRNAGYEKNVPITSQLTCVWGLGGVGKTTLVRKYAWDNCDYFDGNVIWIKADDEQQIQNSFKKLASSEDVNIKLKDWNDRETNMMKIFKFFSNAKSLFIFDNVEKYGGVLDKFLPLNLGPIINKPYFLMTSRKEGLDQKIEDFKLGVPSFEDMNKLMTTKLKLQTNEDKSTAYSIVVQLQGLPLAIQQAISYIHNLEKRKQRFSRKINPIQEYLTLLQDNSHIQTILDFETADDYNETVLRTWTTTIKTISKYETYGSSAERIMHILAYFNNDGINCDILESVYSKQIVEKSLTLLAEYSMIELNEGFISIHRLVQQVIRIQNKSIDPEILQDCLEILIKRPDTVTENSHTIWKSALNYNDLVRKYPRVGIRLCENVHFGSQDSTEATDFFQHTSNKFNEVFGSDGMCALELNCIKIISLCHDMSAPVYSLILQLNDDLIGHLRNYSLASIFDILPTLYRLAGSLLQIGKSPLCPKKKQHEIITHSLKHYKKIKGVERIKSSPGVNAQSGINECRQILLSNPEIRQDKLTELHQKLMNKCSHPLINIIGTSGVGKTTLVRKYIQYYGDYYDDVNWINVDTKESMEFYLLKISGRSDNINLHSEYGGIKLCPDRTHHGPSMVPDPMLFDELELQLLELTRKPGHKKYLLVLCQPKIDVGIVRGVEGSECFLPRLFKVLQLLQEKLHVLVLSTEMLHHFKSSDLNVLHLDVFTQDEAIEQIRDCIPLADNELAGLLAEKLLRFPLALHYATQYLIRQMTIETNSIDGNRNIKEYLELFEQYSARVKLKSHLSDNDKYEHTVEVVWDIAKREIKEDYHGVSAIKIMKMFTFIDSGYGVDFSSPLMHSVDTEYKTIDGIRILEKFGLLTNKNSSVKIHPLLQKIIRKQRLGLTL